MNEELLQKMQQDVAALERRIAGKTAILKEVYGELRTTENTPKTNTVVEILGVRPVTPVSSSFAHCSLPSSSVGFLDRVALSIEVENNSSRCELSARGRVLLSATISTSLLLNSEGEHVDNLRPQERGVLLVSFPQSLFISHSFISLIIDVTWSLPKENRAIPIPLLSLLEKAEDVHPLESYVISVEEPTEWKTLADILSSDERGATRIQHFASVSMISRDFRPLPSYEFRSLFPRFDVADFGEWQLFVGTGSFSGLLVGSSTKNARGLDRVYAQSPHSLDAFLSHLEEKLSITHK